MKCIINLILPLILFPGLAQNLGLNCELGFNDEYNQNSQGVVVDGDHSFILHRESISGSYFTSSLLKKIDTLGNVIWNKSILPQPYENTDMAEIIPAENGGVYLLGWGAEICDVMSLSDWFISKYDANGNEIWSMQWDESSWYDYEMKGLKMIDSGNILVGFTDNSTNQNETKIYSISPTGSVLDSLLVSKPLLDGVDSLNGFDKIGFRQDSLFGFDNSGNTISNVSFTSLIQNIEVFNDTLYVLTTDSIFTVDQTFQLIDGTSIPGYSNYSHLKILPTKVEFISNSGSSISVHQIDHFLQPLTTELVSVQVFSDSFIDFGEKHLTITNNHDLVSYEAIRYLDYSRESSQNELANTTDIGIIDIEVTQTEVVESNSPGAYDFKIWVNVLVKNFGNNPLESCRFNHFVSPWGTCHPNVYGEHISNLNIQPNDSVWVNLGLIHEGVSMGSDTITQEMCIYTSHPNFLTDLNVLNDEHCKNILLGYVGIEEVKKPVEKELIKITDFMGREVKDRPNIPLIYIYSDGSTEKVFRFE